MRDFYFKNLDVYYDFILKSSVYARQTVRHPILATFLKHLLSTKGLTF